MIHHHYLYVCVYQLKLEWGESGVGVYLHFSESTDMVYSVCTTVHRRWLNVNQPNAEKNKYVQ
jgi:hypothetical protein